MCDCLEGDYEVLEAGEEERAMEEEQLRSLELVPVMVGRRKARGQAN